LLWCLKALVALLKKKETKQKIACNTKKKKTSVAVVSQGTGLATATTTATMFCGLVSGATFI
jgi:hypothetical protein